MAKRKETLHLTKCKLGARIRSIAEYRQSDFSDLEASGSSAATEAIEGIVSAMLTSGSTMMSSLERSLEMAAARNDGLSDKESKFKEAKSFVKAHRRTSSVCQTHMHYEHAQFNGEVF